MTITSDFNLQSLNTKEYAENLRVTIEFGGKLMVFGQRGIGKTSIARDMIKSLGYKELYLNLSLFERPDLTGFPRVFTAKDADRYLQFLLPTFYKDMLEGDTPVVALLDELDKADHTLYAPLLEFFDTKSFNAMQLPNLKAIIGTGNLLSEGGSIPPAPLLDRAEKFLLHIDPRHFLDWGAISKKLHPSVSAYIAENPTDLCGKLDQGEDLAGQSPRAWTNASQLLIFGEKHNWHPAMMLHKVAGCVGKKIGTKYSVFFEHYQVLLPIVDRIMQGEKVPEFNQFENTKQLVVCMIMCQRYAQMLDDCREKSNAKSRNNPTASPEVIKTGTLISKFLRNTDPEMALISIRGQIGSQRVLDFNLIEDENWDRILTDLLAKING